MTGIRVLAGLWVASRRHALCKGIPPTDLVLTNLL